MNPLTVSILPQSSRTQFDLFKSRICSVGVIENIAAAIILAFVAILAFIVCPAPVSYILGSVFLTAAFSMLVAASLRFLEIRPKPLPIPAGILGVIKTSFPPAFYKLIVEQRLSIQEFRAVVEALNSGVSLNTLSPELYKKVVNFGERYLYGYEKLQDVELLLSKHCPLHWLYRFIEYSDSCPWENTPLSILQAAYRALGPIASTSGSVSIFNPMTKAVASLITKRELFFLSKLAQKGSWNSDFVVNIRKRLYCNFTLSWKNKIQRDPLYSGKDVSKMVPVFDCSEQGFNRFLLLFSLHNITWKQIELIRLLSSEEWNWLCSIENENSSEPFRIASLGGFLYNSDILDDLSGDYRPEFALLLREEIDEIISEARKKDPSKSIADALGELLSLYAVYAKLHPEGEFSLYKAMKQATLFSPRYKFSSVTGKKVLSEVRV